MDSFIKNISVNDIIFDDKQYVEDDPKEIESLRKSIQQYGIVEPLLLIPKNGKYEILLGKKRYQVARSLGMSTVPALVKNNNINYQDFTNSNEKNSRNRFINPINLNEEKSSSHEKQNRKKNQEQEKNQFSKIIENRNITIENSDIINLSELNREEDERDENQMNNSMTNNQGVPMASTQNVEENVQTTPTFGGRFFPSLEDEPTNMNLGNINIMGQTPPNPVPNFAEISSQNSNNLIDLTDDNRIDPTIQSPTNLNVEQPNFLQQNTNQAISQVQDNNTNMGIDMTYPSTNSYNYPQSPDSLSSIANNLDNNINSRINDNINTTTSNDMMNNSMESSVISNIAIPNQQEIPKFDMSQSIAPLDTNISPATNSMNDTVAMNTLNQSIPSENLGQVNSTPQVSSNFTEMISSESPVNVVENQNIMNQSDNTRMQEQEANNMLMPQLDSEVENQNILSPVQINDSLNLSQSPTPIVGEIAKTNLEIPLEQSQQFPQKEVAPVLDAIKGLAESLKSFGYNINMMEEDLQSSTKLTIEVEK